MMFNKRRVLALAGHISNVYVSFGLLGLLSAVLLAGVLYGVKLDRHSPKIYNMRVVGPTHAGGNIPITADIILPPNCIPRYERKLVKDRDPSKNSETQIITDASVVASGPIKIPLSGGVDPGDWIFEVRVSTAGCGAFSGILPPLIADAYDTSGRLGVNVTVLPRLPVPTY